MSDPSRDVACVVVDYHAGDALAACIDSLHANGVRDIVVVENGEVDSSAPALDGRDVVLVEPRRNLGYGRGVNRGAAATGPARYLLVSNPDVVLHEGAVAAMLSYLDAHDDVAVVGPQILRPDGTVYPSQRVFPNIWLAGAHALLAPLWPDNPVTRIYRSPRSDGTVDWVSGACFLVRRSAWEVVGGFDRAYFMYLEDVDLCWRLGGAGWAVAYEPAAQVVHVQGVSADRHPYRMLLAHHVSICLLYTSRCV